MMSDSATAADVEGQVSGWVSANDRVLSLEASIRSAWNSLDVDHVHFTGCGSANHLSRSAASLFQNATDVTTSSGPGAAFYRAEPPVTDPTRTLLVTISRSGRTTETIDAVRSFRQAGGASVWCVTTQSDSPLALDADLTVGEDAGFEPSIVQTRSFSSMLMLVEGMVRSVAGAALPASAVVKAAGTHALLTAQAFVETCDSLESCARVIFLASGAAFGLAQEGQLLMNEVALTDGSSHEMLDFRHGPISMADDDTVVVALLDRFSSDLELAVLRDVAGLGGTVLALSTDLDGLSPESTLAVDPSETGLMTLFLPAMQLLALRRAAAHGVDPDQPRNLSAVVVLTSTE